VGQYHWDNVCMSEALYIYFKAFWRILWCLTENMEYTNCSAARVFSEN
jgi:hypothetical protein